MSRVAGETDYLVQEFPELPYDRYKIVQNIGKGAFSIVYLAYTPEYHRRAIKRIRLTSKPNQLMREIEFLRKLEGKENIVQVKEIRFSPTVSQTSVITNFCDSDDFKAVIYDYTPRDIHNYMKALLTSLAHCERANILHRDVKPGNFLHVKATNEALLIDFGLAQTVREAEEFPIIRNRSKRRIPLGRPCRKPGDLPYCGPTNREQSKFQPLAPQPHSGTHGYRAPEILHAVSSQGPKIDTWSAGVIMIQMLTGKTSLFRGTPTTDLYELTAIRAIIGTDRFIQGSGLLGADFSLTAGTPNPQHIPLEELTSVLNPDLFVVLPPAAYDLCRRLLAFDPAHRLSATEALKHPFLSCDSHSIPNVRRHPPDLELSADINGYKTNIMRKARGIVLRAGIPLDTAMNISEEYTSAVPHTDLQALPKEHRKLIERLLAKYKYGYYRKEYENMLRYGVGLDRGYVYNKGYIDIESSIRDYGAQRGNDPAIYSSASQLYQLGDMSSTGLANGMGSEQESNNTYKEILGIPSTRGILNLSDYESIKLKPIDLASMPGYSYTPSSSQTMGSMAGRCTNNQNPSGSSSLGNGITSEQEWLKFQQEIEFNNRNKEIFEASVRFTSIRRRLDPWIVPLKLLDKELFLIQRRVREAAEDYRLALIEMGIVELEDDEESRKPNPNNPNGISDREVVIEKIIELRARLGDYPPCQTIRDEINEYKKKYGTDRMNEIVKRVFGESKDLPWISNPEMSAETNVVESPRLSGLDVDVEKAIANTKLHVKVGLKEKVEPIEVDTSILEDTKLVNKELKKRIYPSNYTIGNVNLVKVLTSLMKKCGEESGEANIAKNEPSIDFSDHAEASEIIRKKLDDIYDKEVGIKHRKDHNTSRNYAISKASRKHTIIYRNKVLRQLYNHRLRFTGISVFDDACICSTQYNGKGQPNPPDSNNVGTAENNMGQQITETTSVFSLEETITASDDSNNIQHLQELGDTPIISNVITTNTNFPQINTISTSKTGTLTTTFEVPTINVHTSLEKERKSLDDDDELKSKIIKKEGKGKSSNKQSSNRNKVNNIMNQQTTNRIMSMGGNSSLGAAGGNSDSDVFTRIEEFAKVIEQRKKERKELRKSERLNKYTQSRVKAQKMFSNPNSISEDDPLYKDLLDDLDELDKLTNENADKFGNNKEGVSHITNVLTKPLSLYSTIEQSVKKLIARGSKGENGRGISSNRELFIKYNNDGSIKSIYSSSVNDHKKSDKSIGNGKLSTIKTENKKKSNSTSQNNKLEKTKALADTISSIVGLRASLISAQCMRQQLDEGMGVTSGTVCGSINCPVTNTNELSSTEDTTGTSGKAGALGLAFQSFQGGLGTGGIAKYMVPIRQILYAILTSIENGTNNISQQSNDYTLFFDIPVVFKALIKLINKNEIKVGIQDDMEGRISEYVTWLVSQLCAYVDNYITSTSITMNPSAPPQNQQIVSQTCTTCCDLVNILRRIQCDLDRESVYGTLGPNNQDDMRINIFRYQKMNIEPETNSGTDNLSRKDQERDKQRGNLYLNHEFLENNSANKDSLSCTNESMISKQNKVELMTDKNDKESVNMGSNYKYNEEDSMSRLWKVLLGDNINSEDASNFIGSVIQGLIGENVSQINAKQKSNTVNQAKGATQGENFKSGENRGESAQNSILLGGAGLIVPPRPPCLETLLGLPKGTLLLPIASANGNGTMMSSIGIDAGSVLGYTVAANGVSGTGNSMGLSINGIANSFVDVMTFSIVPVDKQINYDPIPSPFYGRTTSRSRPSRVLQDAGRVPPRMISLGNGLLNSLIEQSTSHLFEISPLAIPDLARECASCALAIRCRLLVGRLSRMWRETCVEIDSLQSSKSGNINDSASSAALRIRRMRVRYISCIIRAMGRFGPAGVLSILRGVAQAGAPTRQIDLLKEVMDKENRTPLNEMSSLDMSNLFTQCFETAINPGAPAMKKIKKAQELTRSSGKSAASKPISRRALFESGLSAASLRQRISTMGQRRV